MLTSLRQIRADRLGVSVAALLTGLGAAPAFAQTAPRAAPADTHAAAEAAIDLDELVVTANGRQPGAVIGDIPPEIQLSPRDIRAYGVSSVSELLDALAPQTASGRSDGRPVVLVNGQRISSFAEIRDVPTEAILRVDILPEEVALKYGYRADQRVVNIVLRPRFRAVTVEAGVKTPTQGNGESYDAKANLFHNRRDTRLLVDAKASKSTPILESERDIASLRGDSAYRTLVSDSRTVSLNAVLTRPLKEGLSATLNGSLDSTKSTGDLGIADPSIFALAAPRALARNSDATTAHVGGSMNGAISGWRWSFTGNGDYVDSDTTSERALAGVAFIDRSQSISKAADGELVVNGVLANLPAGAVSTTFKAGAATSHFDTDALRAGVRRTGQLSRDTGSLQANIDLPIANRAKGVLAGLGDLSGNFNVALDHLSDFGDLTTLGAGLNWSPIKPLRLIASFTQEDGAPTIQQLGGPELVTPGVRVFDFLRGETVEISRVEGGSRTLNADDRKVLKLGLTLKPFSKTDVTFTANYLRTDIHDVIAAFPTATAQIEAAFPGRFVRDATGRLLQIDSRPVNFDRRDTQELRYGFTFRKPLGPVRPPGGFQRRAAADGATPANPNATPGATPGAVPMQGPPDGAGPPPGDAPRDRGPGGFGGGGFGGGGPPGGFGGRGFGPGGGGNLQIGLFHTVRFRDQITIRPGVPVLDLLNGGAIGNSGGQPRHQVDLQGNVSKNGYGLSLNGRWQSATTVRGSAAAGAAGDLNFSDLATLNARLFADLGAQPMARTKYPWMRGARISLAIDNIFDARQQVRAANGVTPITYQPDLLDPLGRTVRLSFRKLFF